MSVKSKKRTSSGEDANNQGIAKSDKVDQPSKSQTFKEDAVEDKSARRKNRRKERRQETREAQKSSKPEISEKKEKEVLEEVPKNHQKAEKKERTEKERKLEDFAKNDVRGLGYKQGKRYLAFSLVGLFLPPLAPVGWLLSAALRSLAKTSGYLLDNRVYAAWVIGLVATIFYLGFLVLIGGLYLLDPEYSLF